MTRLPLLAALALSAPALAQIGPDMICSGHVDVARYGTDPTGRVTAYATGSVSCNHGDEPAVVMLGAIRPLIGQNMYRLKSYPSAQGGTFQRLEHIGQSWAKRVGVPISATTVSCGTCQPASSGLMGINCADTYGSGFNGSFGLLGPRSLCNATLGDTLGGYSTALGDTITRGRIQVPTDDVVGQPADTKFFVENIILLPDDAQHVRPGQTVALNGLNNASSQEIAINGGTTAPTLLAGGATQVPVVQRWRDMDPQVVLVTVEHDDTPNPSPEFPGTRIRTRFYIAARTTALPTNRWRYEYAVFNLNSDSAVQAFLIPMSDAGDVEEYAFRHASSHSGEPYSNAPWPAARASNQLTFATTPWATDPNANAVRWGTTYTFGFTSNIAPATGAGTLTLFKSATTLLVTGIPVPTLAPCPNDYNSDGTTMDDADIEAFFACLSGRCCPACFVGRGDYNLDGDYGTDQDIESFFRVLAGGAC
jgi:hypothetical protein